MLGGKNLISLAGLVVAVFLFLTREKPVHLLTY